MRISHLAITNFRSIGNLELDLPQICALVGPNNAGKSNILRAIQRVLARDWVSVSSFDEQDVYSRDPDLDLSIALTFDPAIGYRRFKGADPVDISTLSFEFTRYKVGERKGQRRLEQKCFDLHGKPPSVLMKAPRKGHRHEYQPLVNVPSEVRDQIPVIYIGTNRSLKDQLPAARYSLLRQLFEDVDRELHDPAQTIRIRGADGVEIEAPRVDQFRELMDRAMAVLRTDSFAALEASLKKNALRQLGLDPVADVDKLDFFFSPFDTMDIYKALDLRIRESGFTISATELGDGMQNALVLAILQAFEERRKQGAILLIEEPEMFLHPQMQRSLYKTLRKIGETNQVIYTTHSPHFVSVPDYEHVALVRKGPGGTTAHRSDLPQDAKRREKLIKELDPERNELFFATRLLLVEGDTEKLAIPEYASRLGLELDQSGVTIVEVGGKRNLPEFVQIAKSFGIPVGVLYDRDASDFRSLREDEARFNAELDALRAADGSVCVWQMVKDYEDELRRILGEAMYQTLCQKFPYGKPTRARLIAREPELDLPDVIKDVLAWLTPAAAHPGLRTTPEEAAGNGSFA